jgi:lipopolysaccharide/colanic/teichoic acid biosynthesis glycosyltransferase
MTPATKGGSVSHSRQRGEEKKLKQTMEGRAREVQRTNRELRVNNTVARDGEQTTEVTRLLRELVSEVARVHRRDSETSAFSDPCSPKDLAAALPLWKRFLDLAIVSAFLPIWLPLMIFVALWVAVTSPGPIFYRQPRIGLRGRRFMLVKFRTMKVNAETHIHEAYLEHLIVSDRPMIKLDATGDPRLIPGGKFLRATALDELAQIFNVLKGEMSLVGPRPCTVSEFERYAPAQRARVNALPGLTGLWQVNGKNRTTFREMIEMDIFYARNICPSLDIKIILRTLPAIIVQFFDTVQPISPPDAQPTPSVKT